MTELVLLGAQVGDVLRIRDGVHRNAGDDLEAEPFDPSVFRRVVRHQPHRRDAEVDEDLRATPDSRESAGNPSSRFASTVSRPWSCNEYARSLWPRPIPRPSWPRRYTTTPWPSFA